jgi:hypothetical protein
MGQFLFLDKTPGNSIKMGKIIGKKHYGDKG